MSVLLIPRGDGVVWPTLGPLVCQFIEECLVFGPGDLLGEPAILDDEKRAFIWSWYELWPRGHDQEGRRRFERVALSLPKGCAKTELAAWIAAAELHPEAPVRFDGWNKDGIPQGRSVRDPYIAMVSYDEEQTELLAYGALKAILEESPISTDFDIGLEKIMRRRGDGKCEALSSSPNARDGARTTFQHFDETHRFVLAKLKETHRVMLANASKRQKADAWSLETTTAPEPGAGSVAEGTMEFAEAVAAGRVQARNFFFFHRQASEKADLTTEEGARAALLEAYGPVAAWANIEAKVNLWHDPQYPVEDWARFFGNLRWRRAAKAFDPAEWETLHRPNYSIPDGALITLGFDGGLYHDGTGLVATEVATGFQQVLGCWEQPFGDTGKDWKVPEPDVDDCVVAAFQGFQVWRMYADPAYWEGWLSTWAGRYGADRVVEWRTNRPLQMAAAIRAYITATQTGGLSHDGHEALARHVANAYRHELKQRDDQDRPLFYIRKERADSPHKIDLAMCGILSWQGYLDAVGAGATVTEWPAWGAA
jgi:hypothetical protein